MPRHLSARRAALALAVAGLLACGGADGGPTAPGTAAYDLLYVGYRYGAAELLLLPADGGAPRRVLAPGLVVSDPDPSPDGRRVAFVITDAEQNADVWVANRDGSGMTRLTTSSEVDDQPAWSPDGTRLAFRSFREGRSGDVFVMDADGTDPVNLTPDPLPGVYEDRRPAWSPDGAFIAFASDRGGDTDLWVMRADGSDERRLTNSTDFDTEPAWSPDGRRIAFRRSSAGATSDVALVDAAGGAVTRLTMPGEQRLPAWAPDGRTLAFTGQATVTAIPQLFAMRPDGGEVTRLTTDDAWGGGLAGRWMRR